jgi:cAMP-dependent protein kinase regulator
MSGAHKEYIEANLTPILKDLVTDILKTKPDNPVPFMIDWLKKYLGIQSTMSERQELSMLRREMARLKHHANAGSEGEETESEEEDYIEVEELGHSKKKGQRNAVSAEAYGAWNKKEHFQPRVIPKSHEQKQKIIERLSRAFMFSALDEKEREIVVNAMEERVVQPGDYVIRQGEDGNELFVVESGVLKCYKRFKGEENDRYLKDYGAGEAFGELALLYNAPRAATIIAETQAVLLVLDRNCFNHIVKDSAVRKREKWEEFLSRVEILSNMDPYERGQLADALKVESYNDGDIIIREGDQGDTFFIVEEGTAKATKTIHAGQPPQEVKSYHAGDYFGELALLKNEPRAANVVATSSLKCVALDRHSFKRLLGPLDNILKREAERYEEILKKLR